MIRLFFGDWAGIVCNSATLLLFLYVFFRFLSLRNQLLKNYEDVRSAVHGKQLRRELEADAAMKVVSDTTIHPKDMNGLKKKYDEICGKFEAVAQIIPIFPSLGILGTVAGLMLQLKAEGLEEMTESISLALSTTLLALIVTVGLKFFAAVLSGTMNRLEVEYRGYDREHQYLLDQKQLKEEL